MPADEIDISRSPAPETAFQRASAELKSRLVREATTAVGMLEDALQALFELDLDAARRIRRDDDAVDMEEVAIEEECFRLMTLQHPVAHDFRQIAFVLKVNQSVERIADNACAVAKQLQHLEPGPPPAWPTALKEMAQRVPIRCHALLHVMMDEDVDAARELVKSDKVIDRLEKQLGEETLVLMRSNPDLLGTGLIIARIGRTLERVGDLLTNICEDLIYLVTGEIVRHAKKRARDLKA